MWPGVGEFWSIFTDELRASPLFLHRTALRVVADAIQMYGFYRTQATVKLDDPVAMKWIERLGFRQESVMKKFSPDRKDVGMYVRHD